MNAGTPWDEAGQPSMGTGSLMRIAPVLIPHLRNPSAQVWSDTAIVSAITHNERGAIAAWVAFICLLWDVLQLDPKLSAHWWPTP